MRPDPLRDPAGDGQEPDGSRPPAGTGAGTDAESGQQGLYLCLPAAPGSGPDPPPDTSPGPPGTGPPDPRDWIGRLRVQLAPIARGSCGHDRAEPGYRPSRALQHLIKVRNARCAAPGCGRPAARCDLDHTTAWDQGGITCECDLAPLCRHHHRCKQAEGWRLTQPEPGILVWRTPSGRSYSTMPTTYPI